MRRGDQKEEQDNCDGPFVMKNGGLFPPKRLNTPKMHVKLF